jgi:7-carboxy-7-deazaguanine synthase
LIGAGPSERESAIARGERLRVNEIFYSLQGEADAVGYPTVFVRLTGCPLRCHYCDTEYAFYDGQWTGIGAVLDEVAGFGARHVCVTGGEPLAQPNCARLLTALCNADYRVSLETSGALDTSVVDPRVAVVLDVKTPGSGEERRNRLENLALLKPEDQVKFVICSREDYEWSRSFVQEHALIAHCQVLFSPSYNDVAPTTLADWILSDRLDVRFQLQLHKILWGDVPGK